MSQIFSIIWEIVGKGLHAFTVLKILYFALPQILSFSIPSAVMIGVVMGIGRLSHDNEIVAMEAAGYNPINLFIQVFTFSFFIFCFLIWFCGFFTPNSNYKLRSLYFEIAKKKPVFRLKAFCKCENLSGYDIFPRDVNYRTQEVKNITIYDRKEKRFIFAKYCKVYSSPDFIILKLRDGWIEEGNFEEFERIRFKTYTLKIKYGEKERKTKLSKIDDELTLFELWKRIKKEKKKRGRIFTYRLRRYFTEFHKKISLSFSAFVLALTGLLLSLRFRRAGKIYGFGISVPFFLFYYSAFVGMEGLGDRGVISPAFAMWLPNLIVLIFSFILYKWKS